ncbi:MAG: DNA-binding protein [Rhizonema sp. PD38]|nr:DNA-binding protein [Rhizonema sp. PD38]
MIKNEQEYHTTKEWLQRFEQSLAELDNNETLKAEPIRWQLHRDSCQSQVDELREEIAEYKRLTSCDKSKPIQIKVESFNKLPNALIKARIAASLSHKELANLLGIEEQKVKEYEDSDYQCASFIEILEVSTVLGVEFESAIVRIDFDEIENVKQTIQKWNKGRVNVSSTT